MGAVLALRVTQQARGETEKDGAEGFSEAGTHRERELVRRFPSDMADRHS